MTNFRPQPARISNLIAHNFSFGTIGTADIDRTIDKFQQLLKLAKWGSDVQLNLIDERRPLPINLGDSPNILVTRLSAIGDCILTLPLVSHLKKTWPTAKLTWVVDCAVAELIGHHPCVDEVIRLKKGFALRPIELYRLRRQLRNKHFQMAIDPQGLAKSAILGWLSAAPIRLGFDSCQAREGSHFLYTTRRHPLAQHLVERQLELLEMCNIDLPDTDPSGWLNADFGWNSSTFKNPELDQQMHQLGLSRKCFFIMNPGAGWESKRWPLDRYAVLSEMLLERTGMPTLVVWGGQREYDFARTISALAPTSTIVAPSTSLWSLAQWCERAALFIGSDTGPMHLAASIGTSCVAMYGTSLPQNCGPYGGQHAALQKRYDGGTSRHRRSTTNAAMKSIEVEDVLQACLERLACGCLSVVDSNGVRTQLHAA